MQVNLSRAWFQVAAIEKSLLEELANSSGNILENVAVRVQLIGHL